MNTLHYTLQEEEDRQRYQQLLEKQRKLAEEKALKEKADRDSQLVAPIGDDPLEEINAMLSGKAPRSHERLARAYVKLATMEDKEQSALGIAKVAELFKTIDLQHERIMRLESQFNQKTFLHG